MFKFPWTYQQNNKKNSCYDRKMQLVRFMFKIKMMIRVK